MITFLKENWYKLMIGFSMVTFSLSALIYSISPAMANDNEHNIQFNSNIPVGNKGITIGQYTYFVDAGYVFKCNLGKSDLGGKLLWQGTDKDYMGKPIWEKSKLP
jgi:hypothetical protein